MLVLLGSAQHPTYAHTKLLGQCYDNVYHQGRLICDLPAQGKPPTNEQIQKIYNQEYEEVVAWIENTLDLLDQTPTYPMVPTSLLNPDIILPPKGLPQVAMGCMPSPRTYEFDGTQGLVDLS